MLLINKDFYPVYLYSLRKRRYILEPDEFELLQRNTYRLPNKVNEINNALTQTSKKGYLLYVKFLVQHIYRTYSPNLAQQIINNNDSQAIRFAVGNGHFKIVPEFEEFQLAT